SAGRHNPLLDSRRAEYASAELVPACGFRRLSLQPSSVALGRLRLAGGSVGAVSHVHRGSHGSFAGTPRRQSQAAGRAGTPTRALAGCRAAAASSPSLFSFNHLGAVPVALAPAYLPDPA